MELLPPPSSGHGRSSCAPAPTLYTKHIKEVMSQQPLLTKWDKASPGGSRSLLTSFKGEKCSHTRAGAGLKSAQRAGSTPAIPTHTGTNTSDQLIASLRYSQKALPKGISPTEKAAKERLVCPNMHRLTKGRELLWAAPGRQPGAKPCPCVSIQKLQNQLVTLYYIYCP